MLFKILPDIVVLIHFLWILFLFLGVFWGINKPHPKEGGYFVETYRPDETIPEEALPKRYRGNRSYATAIYYFITQESFSTIHRLKSDEGI